MKRVCFISLPAYGFFNEEVEAAGGAERQLYLLSSNLSNQFDTHFIVGDYGQPDTERREGVTLHRAYTPNPEASIFDEVHHLSRLVDAIRRADADLYIARCLPRQLAVHYAVLSLFNRPLLYHIATDSFLEKPPNGVNGLRKKVYERALRRIEIVTQTPRQAQLLDTNWGRCTSVIPNGYPPASEINIPETREFFLWVGRLDESEKQPHKFLDLAERIPEKRFVLIGPPERDDEYTEELLDRTTKLQNVSYEGHVAPSRIHEYYRRAIALVNTSVRSKEGFPNTFLEAWRYATPVLTLNIDTKRFLLTERSVGYADREFDELVALCRTLAGSADAIRRMGVTGLEAFQSQYDISRIAEVYANVIESVIDA